MDRFNGKPTQASAVTQPTAEPQPQPKVASTPTADPTSVVPADPASMAHFLEVKNALTREEQALVGALARDLTPAEQAAWFNALRPLSVADAVASVRSTLAQFAGQQPAQAATT